MSERFVVIEIRHLGSIRVYPVCPVAWLGCGGCWFGGSTRFRFRSGG